MTPRPDRSRPQTYDEHDSEHVADAEARTRDAAHRYFQAERGEVAEARETYHRTLDAEQDEKRRAPFGGDEDSGSTA